MKTVFALCLILALTCAQSTYKPKWKSCEGPKGWLTQKVTLNTAPVAGEDVTFIICGQNRNVYMIDFQEVHVTPGTDLVFPIDIRVTWGSVACYNVNFKIPLGAQELALHFSSTAYDLGEQGCVDVILNLGEEKNFLAF